ncbi:kinesin-like protein KIF19 [Orycteropus afer afer]|uniref:Kinesin-like protein n=1 Tax=Orycteropus afer afer TaxID=1230840 RepID=A0A8B7A1D8_ORYAF|nr:kinesin-like protein KIF19 [Orycteropus afer afer]
MREIATAEPKDQQLMVALRIRPLNDAEVEEGATTIAHKVGDQMVVLMDPGEDPEDTQRAHRSREKTFIFDTVLDQHASQEDVYCATTQRLVEGVISGYNATVFAYGPSGAGKTYTMLGMDAEPGIYLQTLTDLFQAIEETRDNMDYSVSMSYLEIYNEVIRDLLNPSSGFLDLREDSRGSIQIPGITEVSTSNAQEIMQLLTRGNRERTQEPTATNQTSSRSHAVLQVTVRQWGRGTELAEAVRVGRLFMVDLAGSERASQTQNQGKRMKEGAHINRSLLALGNCINALSEKGGGRAQYVNFRDSKLTRLLKDALGGNSRTVMIAHISPASTHFEESRTTLLYAYRAKNIKTRVKRNLLNVSYHIAQYTDVISDLRREIEHLKSKLEKQEKRSEPDTQDVQAVIPAHDTEEESRQQMNKIRAQLIGAFKEQLEMRRSLVELENTNIELHVDTSRHLLTIADWEREKTHQAHGERPGPEGGEELQEADVEGECAEPPEVALAREEISTLLAEQRKTAALKVGRQAAAPHNYFMDGETEAQRASSLSVTLAENDRLALGAVPAAAECLQTHLQPSKLQSKGKRLAQRSVAAGRGHPFEGRRVLLCGIVSAVPAGMKGHGAVASMHVPVGHLHVPVGARLPTRLVSRQAGLEQRLANAKKKASQMEKLLPRQAISEGQREVLQLLCRAHELEVENTELQARSLCCKNLLRQKDFVIQRCRQHRLLGEQLVREQRQLIQDMLHPPSSPGTGTYVLSRRLLLLDFHGNGGLVVPDALEKRYRLYSQERGEGTLNRLLLLHSLMAGALHINVTPARGGVRCQGRGAGTYHTPQRSRLKATSGHWLQGEDGSVLNGSPPPPEDSSRDQADGRKDLPWGAQFELPPMLLETDRYRAPLPVTLVFPESGTGGQQMDFQATAPCDPELLRVLICAVGPGASVQGAGAVSVCLGLMLL